MSPCFVFELLLFWERERKHVCLFLSTVPVLQWSKNFCRPHNLKSSFKNETQNIYHSVLCVGCLSLQHQFYGESTPFGKKSHKTAEILGYLNSQQALADYAIMIRSLKQNLSSEASPVVVFGGSYGGSKLTPTSLNGITNHSHKLCSVVCYVLRQFLVLAAWFRLKYPHIAIGALASSAPILQFDNIVPLTSFYDAISQDFKVLYALFAGNIIQKWCYNELIVNYLQAGCEC